MKRQIKIIVEHLSRYKEDMQELKNKYPEYFKIKVKLQAV